MVPACIAASPLHDVIGAALPGMRRHGLLSARALCHLLDAPAANRPALLTRNRDDYARLTHPFMASAIRCAACSPSSVLV